MPVRSRAVAVHAEDGGGATPLKDGAAEKPRSPAPQRSAGPAACWPWRRSSEQPGGCTELRGHPHLQAARLVICNNG